jgi:hypothetical protein
VIYYRFHEANGPAVVITDDITGANLPKSQSAWKADGQTQVAARGPRRFGVAPEEIIAAIARDGFYLGSRRDR